MSWWHRFFDRDRREQDLDAEIRAHLQTEVQQRIERGEPPDQAWANACKDFGNVALVKEVTREVWSFGLIESLLEDLRFAFRLCLRYPGFSLAVILILGITIGINVAVFSVMNAVTLRPLPYGGPERVVTFDLRSRLTGAVSAGISAGLMIDLQESRAFESVAVSVFDGKNWTGAGEPLELQGVEVSASFFDVLAVKPAAGRLLGEEDTRPQADRAVVFTHELWTRRLGRDPNAIGKTLVLDGTPYTLVGVLPKGFIFPDGTSLDFYLPAILSPAELSFHGPSGHLPFARLRPGVSVAQTQAVLDDLAKNLESRYPQTNAGLEIRIVPVKDRIVGEAPPFLFVQGTALFVLLIGCANLASLFVSRSIARSHEVSIRASLGASRGRIVRQMLIDGSVLGVLGGALGLFLAFGTVRVFGFLLPDVPRIKDIPLDGNVLLFTAGITTFSTLFFALVPAFRSSGTHLQSALSRSHTMSGAGWGRFQSRGILVSAEVAMTLMLLILAGLAVNSSIRLASVNPGFRTDNVLTMQIRPSGYGRRKPAELSAFYGQAVERIQGIPGVEAAAAASYLPMNGVSGGRTNVMRGEVTVSGHVRMITPDYFRTLSIPLEKGRAFGTQDRLEAQSVAMVNERMAEQLSTGDLIGSTIYLGKRRFTIVGIAKNALDNSHAPPRPEVYLPLLQAPNSYPSVYLLARTSHPPQGMTEAIRNRIWEIDRNQPISEVATYRSLVLHLNRYDYFLMSLQTCFAVLGICLAALGIYSVLSYAVGQRTREICVRMALGAQRTQMVKLVLGQAAPPVIGGMILGLMSSIAVAIYAKSRIPFVLFHIRETDLVTYATVTLLLLAIAVLAAYLPARRASRMDPASVLRHE
jgi:putative ABC transport system permease protein